MNALENLKQRIDYFDLPKQAQRAVDLTLEACEKSQQIHVDRCKELAAKVVHYQDRINELLGEGYKVIQERDALRAEVERLKSEPVKAVTLTCAELQEAYYLGCPDETPDQEQTEMYIKWLDDGHSGAGYYCWVSECAEEGCIKLGEVKEQTND